MPYQAIADRKLSLIDAIAIIVGIVLGAGIFKTPSLVAAHAHSGTAIVLLWLAGGIISFIGALCYAELTTAYPHAGGEYHYMLRAFGKPAGFLFAWARMTVIQAGSIAMLAFLIGDYASQLVNLGKYSSSYYAAGIVTGLTALNAAGIKPGSLAQRMLIVSLLLGMSFVVFVGFSSVQHVPAFPPEEASGISHIGKAMIFVLLTYGGWNEAAYLSAEIRQSRKSMIYVLFYSIGIITAIYLVTNLAFLNNLGLPGMSRSEVVAADVLKGTLGENGSRIISFLVALAAFSTLNGSMITGARTNYALGNDFALFKFLGRWKDDVQAPVNALVFQGAIALGLIVLGTGTRSGFTMMVEYTAPVFWFFFLLVGIALFVLRNREPLVHRPFHVPFYPVTPFLFCVICAGMLFSSIAYTGKGGLIGVGVLLAGTPLLFIKQKTP